MAERIIRDVGAAVGARIRDARERAALSQADLAAAIGRSQGTVSSWEAGRRAPGLDDLVAVADALGIHVGELFAEAQRSGESPGLMLRMEAGRLVRDEILTEIDLFVEKASTLKVPRARYSTFSGDPVTAARVLIEMAEIQAAPVRLPPIVRDCGAGLQPWPFDRSISGLFVELDNGPVIGFNKRHHPRRARFTVAHELGHHVLHHHHRVHIDLAVVTSAAGDPPGTDWALEREANRFASELLMPAELLVPHAKRRNANAESLAEQFGVSVEAMGFRLVSLGLRGGQQR